MNDNFTTSNASATIVEKERRKRGWPLSRTLSVRKYGGIGLMVSAVLMFIFGGSNPFTIGAVILSFTLLLIGLFGGFVHAHAVMIKGGPKHPDRRVAKRLMLIGYAVIAVIAVIAVAIYGLANENAPPGLREFGLKVLAGLAILIVLGGILLAGWVMDAGEESP